MKSMYQYPDYKLNNMLKPLLPLLKDANAMLAGGSCLTRVQIQHSIISENSDYDFFFENEQDYQKVIKRIKRHQKDFTDKFDGKTKAHVGLQIMFNDKYITESYSNEFTTTWQHCGIIFQLIKMYKPHERQIEEFDLDNSKYWSFYPFDTIETNQDKDTLYNIKIGKVDFKGINRMMKYHQNKRININSKMEEAFELFNNYDDDDFENGKYEGKEIVTEEQKTNYLKNTLLGVLRNQEFKNIAIKKENQGITLPFTLFDIDDLNMCSNKGIQVLDFLRIQKGLDNDLVNFTKEDVIEFVADKFPELLL